MLPTNLRDLRKLARHGRTESVRRAAREQIARVQGERNTAPAKASGAVRDLFTANL